MLNRSGESRHPCFCSCLRGNAFSLLLLSMLLAVVFSYMVYIILKKLPFILSWIFFSLNDEMALNFVKSFFCISGDDNVVFPFILFLWFSTLLGFHKLNCLLHSKNKSHLFMVYSHFNVLLFIWNNLTQHSINLRCTTSSFRTFMCSLIFFRLYIA